MLLHELIPQLMAERPSFHGQGDGGHNWGLAPDVLDWIAETIRPGDKTIETGCGYSTLVFAAADARHTTISPFAEEHERIAAWAKSHGIACDNVTFIAKHSEDVLPNLESASVQIALIDGWHAFPGPYLDWFYLGQRLATQGFLIVDDTQLPVCRILRDFLRKEKGRWEVHRTLGKTEIFRKTSPDLFIGDWDSQPFGATPIVELKEYFTRFLRNPLARMARMIPGAKACVQVLRRRKP
jgi:hypothetical protein